MDDLFRSLGSIIQVIQAAAPVVETILEETGANQNSEIAPAIDAIRKVGAITQSVAAHVKQIEDIQIDEETEVGFNAETIRTAEAITKCGFSIYKQILSSNHGTETTDDIETANELETFTTSIFSNAKKVLENSPSDQNNETPDGVETVHRVAAKTKSVVSVIDGVLKDLNVPETEPAVDALGKFKSSISEIDGNLEEVVAEEQCGETALNTAEVLPVRTLLDSLTHHSKGEHQRGNEALISATRDSFVMGAGAAGFTYFGETGAAVAGMISSAVFDGFHTHAKGNTDGPKGIWTLMESSKPEDIRNAVKTVISDGLVGYTGGKLSEIANRSSEIDAFERVKQYRGSLKLKKPKAKMEVWTEVKDMATGKLYYGTNITVRKKLTNTELKDPIDNIYVRECSIDEKLPLNRKAQTCAEMQAFHRMLEDQPKADVTNTQVHTFVLRQDRQKNIIYKNITRCANCLTRDHYMGRVPTDKASSGILVDENVPDNMPSEYYEYCIVFPTWYCAEHSIITRDEYNKNIRDAISASRHLKKKSDV